MNILSVNTGIPKSYTLDGITLETSMVRTPQDLIKVKAQYVVGDIFKSPNIHGVPEAAVYALSVDRYEYWSEYLGYKVGIGFFGENLSVDKLREENIFIHDEYEVGSVILRATGPRYPCNRLNFVSGNKNTRDHFAEKAWPGVYFEVLEEGEIKAHDKIVLKNRVQNDISVMDVFLALRSLERREPLNDQIRKVKNSAHVLEKYKTRLKKLYLE
jgi:MOSC domain-containing protein YiiM